MKSSFTYPESVDNASTVITLTAEGNFIMVSWFLWHQMTKLDIQHLLCLWLCLDSLIQSAA